MCQIIKDGWKLITLAWHYGCSCGGVTKWIVSTKLQLNYSEFDGVALYIWRVTTFAIDVTCS